MNWLAHLEFIGLMVTILACFFMIHKDVRDIETRLDQRIQKESDRSDRLYEMFIDLLKERK